MNICMYVYVYVYIVGECVFVKYRFVVCDVCMVHVTAGWRRGGGLPCPG